MPVETTNAARAAIFSRFKTAWDVSLATVPVIYQGAKIQVPATTGPWARISVQHASGAQATMGQAGNRKFTDYGTVFVEIRVPSGTGMATLDSYVDVAVNAFKGKHTSATGVWFRNVRKKELGADGAYELVHVLADFEYDQVM